MCDRADIVCKYRQSHKIEILARAKKYRQTHKEQIAKSHNRWMQAHKVELFDRMKIYHREYYQSHKNKKLLAAHARYIQNIENKKQYNKQWYNKNKSLILKQKRAYRILNLDEILKRNRILCKKHYQANKQQYTIRRHIRRAREHAAVGMFTINDVNIIRVQQQDLCYYCHIPLNSKGTIEHKLPLSRGGSNWPDNIALSCKKCNDSKCNKTVEEFMKYLQFKQQLIMVGAQ